MLDFWPITEDARTAKPLLTDELPDPIDPCSSPSESHAVGRRAPASDRHAATPKFSAIKSGLSLDDRGAVVAAVAVSDVKCVIGGASNWDTSVVVHGAFIGTGTYGHRNRPSPRGGTRSDERGEGELPRLACPHGHQCTARFDGWNDY